MYTHTGTETAKYMQTVVLKSLTHFVDLSCDKYSTPMMCAQSASNISEIIDWTFIRKGIPHQQESAVFPILEIVSSHAEEEDDD